MLFGGNSGSCGGCGCKSCQECTRTCTNPHTGTAFETVYTLFFEGAEAGNPSDGYLDATGDSDTSDPYDGMDGNGPWSQTVSGTFSLTKTTTRFPCYFRASFWRSNFVLGANTIPPPATTLTEERIKVTNSVLSEGPIVAGGEVLLPGESHEFATTIPTASGAGDQSGNDPHAYAGSIAVSAVCGNDTVIFTVDAKIAWNVKKRQHVLYGQVRECYGSNPCLDRCVSPDTFNDILYIEVTGFTDEYGLGIAPEDVNGTYVAERWDCDSWISCFGVLSASGSVGRLLIGTCARYSTSAGTGPLRRYTLEGVGTPLSNTGVNYQCGSGDMGSLTTEIGLWKVSIPWVTSDANAGTVSIRVYG